MDGKFESSSNDYDESNLNRLHERPIALRRTRTWNLKFKPRRPWSGAIAVMTRGRRAGHVGIITGIDASGNPIMISGNNGNRVREAPVSRGRIYAYVMPTS